VQIQDYFYTQLPVWARPNNPVLRYMLHREDRRRNSISRWLTRVLAGATMIGLFALSYWAYQQDRPLGLDAARSSALYTVLYFPLVIIQFFTLLVALSSTSNMLADEHQRGTWEPVKITSHGAELSIRARWAAVFYRMRWWLAALVVARVVFLGQMLIDLTDYQGYHLDLYITGITPEVSLEAAVLLLAALMTAALIQPFVLIGLNAAVGLTLSTVVSNRYLAPLARVVVVLVELGLFSAALLATDVSSRVTAYMPSGDQWDDQFFMALAGDQSLRLLDLRTTFETWADAEYGILLGAAILGTVLILAALTNGMLWWGARRAGPPARD
jgi:hypothetical protein